MPTVYTAKSTASDILKVPRACPACGHSWFAQFKIEASGEQVVVGRDFHWAQMEAERDATKNLAKKKRGWEGEKIRNNLEEQILCPVCSHFCTEAMKKHFPGGYASGLLKRYRIGQILQLLYGLGIGIVAASLLMFLGPLVVSAEWWQAIFASLEGEEWYVLLLGALLPFVLAIAVTAIPTASVWFLAKFVRSVISYPEIARSLRSSSESELQALAVECYHKNKDSLSARMRWVNILATCIPGPPRKFKGASTMTKACAHCDSVFYLPKTMIEKTDFSAMQRVRVGCSKCGQALCFSCAATAADERGESGNCYCPNCGAELGEGGEAGELGEHFSGWD